MMIDWVLLLFGFLFLEGEELVFPLNGTYLLSRLPLYSAYYRLCTQPKHCTPNITDYVPQTLTLISTHYRLCTQPKHCTPHITDYVPNLNIELHILQIMYPT